MDNHQDFIGGSSVEEYKGKAEKMLQWGIQASKDQLLIEHSSVGYGREEYCIGATLHRGYYYPSPVYDLLVGNEKRGSLRTKPTRSKNISHRYFFDKSDKLVRIDRFYQERVSGTEYLCYDGNRILGFTIDRSGFLAAVSEEVYEGNRLDSFSLMNCYFINEQYVCFEYREEHYYYNTVGLRRFRYIYLSPDSGYFVNNMYQLEQEDGFLTSYQQIDPEQSGGMQTVYKISKRRKA